MVAQGNFAPIQWAVILAGSCGFGFATAQKLAERVGADGGEHISRATP